MVGEAKPGVVRWVVRPVAAAHADRPRAGGRGAETPAPTVAANVVIRCCRFRLHHLPDGGAVEIARQDLVGRLGDLADAGGTTNSPRCSSNSISASSAFSAGIRWSNDAFMTSAALFTLTSRSLRVPDLASAAALGSTSPPPSCCTAASACSSPQNLPLMMLVLNMAFWRKEEVGLDLQRIVRSALGCFRRGMPAAVSVPTPVASKRRLPPRSEFLFALRRIRDGNANSGGEAPAEPFGRYSLRAQRSREPRPPESPSPCGKRHVSPAMEQGRRTRLGRCQCRVVLELFLDLAAERWGRAFSGDATAPWRSRPGVRPMAMRSAVGVHGKSDRPRGPVPRRGPFRRRC